MFRTSLFPTALAGAALVISVAAAATVALDRVSDRTLVRGEGPRTAAPRPPFESDALSRLLFPRLHDRGSPHDNQMISLAHNWDWDADAGWSRRDLDAPSVALTVESWFNGLAELNFDMRPPRNATDWPGGRLMGFAARHDGTYATMSLGGGMFNPAGAGIKLTAGAAADPLILLSEAQDAPSTVLKLVRGDKSAALTIYGGASPALALGLSGTAPEPDGAGVLRFSGPLGEAPLINVSGAGAHATLLASTPGGDARAFRISAEGALEWRHGTSGKSASLAAQGDQLVVGGPLAAASLRVGAGSAEIRQIRVAQIDIRPAELRAHATAEQAFKVAGIGRDAIIVLNGPAQPDGIGIAQVRASGSDAIAVTFVNASAQPRRPAAGRYLVLAIAAEE